MSRIRAVVAKAAADNTSAKQERMRQHAQDAEAAGTLVTSGSFGGATVEIYAGGFVRVGLLPTSTSQPKLSDISLRPPGSITKNTPYEKLRSIAFTPPARDRASGSSSALEGAVGPAVANILKGGKSLMKGTVPGLAAAAVAHIAGAEGRKAFLTIATDKQIHTLISTSNGGQKDVGLALEAAGRSVLRAEDVAARPASGLEPATEPPPVSGPGAAATAPLQNQPSRAGCASWPTSTRTAFSPTRSSPPRRRGCSATSDSRPPAAHHGDPCIRRDAQPPRGRCRFWLQAGPVPDAVERPVMPRGERTPCWLVGTAAARVTTIYQRARRRIYRLTGPPIGPLPAPWRVGAPSAPTRKGP